MSSRPRLGSGPELFGRAPRPLDEGVEFQEGHARIDLAVTGRGSETAVGAGNDPLAADYVGETHNPLGDKIRMLDVVAAQSSAFPRKCALSSPALSIAGGEANGRISPPAVAS